jgi:hypothetical protein
MYDFDYSIINLGDINKVNEYLGRVYSEIVAPMEKQIKLVMIQFQFAIESELYASNLNFRLCEDSTNNRYKGDPSLKQEYSVINLNQKLGSLLKKFNDRYFGFIKEFGEIDPRSDTNVSVALYVGTYFHYENSASKAYKAAYEKDKNFIKFYRLHMEQYAHSARQTNFKYLNKCYDFKRYFEQCRKAENGFGGLKNL